MPIVRLPTGCASLWTRLNMSGGSLYDEVQVKQVWICLGVPMYSVFECIMDNGPLAPLWTDKQTRLKTLLSRNFVGGGKKENKS